MAVHTQQKQRFAARRVVSHVAVGLSMVLLAGCTMTAPTGNSASIPNENVYPQQPQQAARPVAQPAIPQGYGYEAMQQAPSPQFYGYSQMPATPVNQVGSGAYVQQQALTEIDGLRDRLRRAERAMIRLDQRLQLIEKQELERMSAVSTAETVASNAGGQMVPMSARTQIDMPVSAHNRSVLGTPQSYTRVSNKQQSVSASVGNGLPSLADPVTKQGDQAIEIWTVNYLSDKIWPTRDELLKSGAIAQLLRQEGPVNIFARGADPTSNSFRERVRALSQYLGQVSERESLPIATLPAEHMSTDTIELVVTR